MAQGIAAALRRLSNTILWSWQGWRAAWTSEPSLRQWTAVNAVSVVAALVLDLTGGERAPILALGVLLLAAELVNTAIEEAVNIAAPDPHPLAKKAKDCGSAGVALTAIAGGVAWIAVLAG